MLVAHLRTANTSSDSLEDTPLVTPDSPTFPSLGSAVELTSNVTTESTKSYGLFAPIPKPLPLRPSFGVDLTSPTRRSVPDGRLREPSANGHERAQALGTVRKMLEELHVSPDYRPIPRAPTNSVAWTPMDRYVPPWKLNQLQGSSPGATGKTSHLPVIPKINVNYESLDELAMLKDLENQETNTSAWDNLNEAVRVVEKLQGPNWASWSFWIRRKICLANETAWGHIDGSCTRESSGDWDADEAAIYCALLSSLDFNVIDERVRACTTAKEVWEHLELLYKEKLTPECRAVRLIRNVARMRYYEGADLQRYLHRFAKIADQLKDGPYPIPFELVKEFVLSSLPSSILKDATPLRTKEHTSIHELCRDILELSQVVVEGLPSGLPERYNYVPLPPDLRHYKYTGDGVLSDGALYFRAKKACGACLSHGHKAYAPNCPQTEARLGLWGLQKDRQRPWTQCSECSRKDSMQALHADGRVSGPTTPGGSGNHTRMTSGSSNRMRTSSAGGLSFWSEHSSPRSRVPSDGAGTMNSRPGRGLSVFELESWR